MTSLLELFCHVDDFWQVFCPVWYEHLLANGERQRIRDGQLSDSEVITYGNRASSLLPGKVVRRNMKPQLMDLADRLMLRKRSIIETINDQLKSISQIEHSRHRSVDNFFVNLMAGLMHTPSTLRNPLFSLILSKFACLSLADLIRNSNYSGRTRQIVHHYFENIDPCPDFWLRLE